MIQGVGAVTGASDGSFLLTVSVAPETEASAARLRDLGHRLCVVAAVLPDELPNLSQDDVQPSGAWARPESTDTEADRESIFVCGGVLVDIDARLVFVEGERLLLPYGEFELLLRLVRNKGRVLSRTELVGEPDRGASLRSVDVLVARLRRKLAQGRGFSIETVPNVGYRCSELTSSEGSPTPDTIRTC
jgi:two-component system alkaline phosphatase synthesis response regulator PhoP